VLDHYVYVPGVIPVTTNLYAAFALIGKIVSGYVWADVICINQKDPAERDH
jgi:hypothetical protein